MFIHKNWLRRFACIVGALPLVGWLSHRLKFLVHKVSDVSFQTCDLLCLCMGVNRAVIKSGSLPACWSWSCLRSSRIELEFLEMRCRFNMSKRVGELGLSTDSRLLAYWWLFDPSFWWVVPERWLVFNLAVSLWDCPWWLPWLVTHCSWSISFYLSANIFPEIVPCLG